MKDGVYFEAADCDPADFQNLIDRSLDISTVPYAAGVVQNVPLYDMSAFSDPSPRQRTALMAEWTKVLGRESGVLVLKGAYQDTTPIEAATSAYNTIIEREKALTGGGDHFASAGANDRIWNSLQKLCQDDPKTFAVYFGNTAIASVCEAWLGPGYQMTSQVNLVRPGGKAQVAHRDYHLGFQTEDTARRFPAHVHDLSAVMTLQGAIAHCDMPVESGPTKLLPFSQLYKPGYLAYRDARFRDMFEENYVQIPLEKGDVLFFNPALFHGAGDNVSADILRMANLLQVSSPFGRAMEAIDRDAMCRKLYPAILQLKETAQISPSCVMAAVASCAEGYSFPTNLDSDPPKGGLAPETQAALFLRALNEGMSEAEFGQELYAQSARRAP